MCKLQVFIPKWILLQMSFPIKLLLPCLAYYESDHILKTETPLTSNFLSLLGFKV